MIERYDGGDMVSCSNQDLTRFNKIAIQGALQMAVDKEAIRFSNI